MPYATIIKWVLGAIGGLALAWAVYAGIIRPITKPNPSTAQKADTIYNYYNQPKVFFGCAAWDIPKKDITPEVVK